MALLNKLKPAKTTTASIADGHLVLSLLDAQAPKIWRMDLNKIGTATFELKSEKDSETTKLILKPKKGTAEIIAAFDTKDAAFDALTIASDALNYKQVSIKQRSEKDITSKQMSDTSQSSSKKWILLLIGFVTIILLYVYMTTLIPQTTIGFEQTPDINSQSSGNSTTGVPLSADEFLGSM